MTFYKDILSRNLLDYMEKQTLDYIKDFRIVESSINNTYYISITKEDLISRFGITSGYRTMTSNGKPIMLPITENCIRFPVRINLLGSTERKVQLVDAYNGETLYDRGLENIRSLEVFVNGAKIPDKQVYIYKTTLATDLFIPERFFGSNNSILVCLKDYTNYPYTNHYIKDNISNTVRIPKPNDNIPITNYMIKNYIKEKLIPYNKYTVTEIGNEYEITFDESLNLLIENPNYNLEIYIDKTITGRYLNYYINNSNKLIFIIPDFSVELQEGPIFRDMCEFYINGSKVSGNLLRQLDYKHILYEAASYTPGTILNAETIITDIRSTSIKISNYIDDFIRLSKWKNDTEFAKTISGENDNTLLQPDWANYNDSNFLLPDEYIIDRKNFNLISLKQHIQNLIADNPTNISHMLSNFGSKIEKYTAQNIQTSPYSKDYLDIVIDTDSDDEYNSNTRALSVYINEKKVPNSDAVQMNYWKNDIVRVPKSYFTDNDKIRLIKTPIRNNNMKYFKINMQDITFDTFYEYPLTNLGNVQRLSDIKIFKRIHIDNEEIYTIPINNNELYYQILLEDDYELDYRNIGNGQINIKIKIKTSPRVNSDDVLLIANSCYYSVKAYTIPEGEPNDINRSRYILNDISIDGEVLPFILGEYSMEIFNNGELLIPGLDYLVYTPEIINNIAFSILLFIRKVNPGDKFEIITTNIDNRHYAMYDVIPHTNKYGLIYFEDLQIPFNLDYMDLWVNDKLMSAEDIEILSDRLIRIKREYLPFINIHLYTRFTEDFYKFQEYIDIYNTNKSLFDLYIRHYCLRVIFDPIITDPPPLLENDITEAFEEAPNYIDDTNKTPNPKEVKSLPERINIFINRLMMDYKYGTNVFSKYINSNREVDIRYIEHLLIMDLFTKESKKVIFNANEAKSLFEDFNFDCNEYYRPRGFVVALIADMIKSGLLKSTMDSNILDGTIIVPSDFLQRYQYPSDFVEMNSNIDLGSNDNLILDSNIIPDFT